MKRIILLSTLIFSACQNNNIDSSSKITEIATHNKTETVVTDETESDFLISQQGIGKAKLGMTIGELKQKLAPETSLEIISPFMVDTTAIAVSDRGIVQYYILYEAGSTSHPDGITPTDKDPITFLMTDNQNYQTRAGVKVGTPIEEAEKIYGSAVLAYNSEGESREYVVFGGENPENISFRASYFKTISDGLDFSGIYLEYPGGNNTTDKYHDGAAIAAIEVACDPENCITQR